MKVFKQSTRFKPKISLILLDWSVRESFHLLHYLSLQSIPREQFEVVIIEYYSRRSEAIEKFENEVDTWIALEMPDDVYYHKHLMYNAGIAASTGEICIICDSDAMAKPTFLETVINAFEQDPDIILHIDQYRNNRKDLYPFCYPSFEEVTGRGCINIKDGKTTGLAVTEDLIHNRNYGACFCAKREDLIKIGGADEHIDFIGHICGPYDFTFRLMNIGKKEVWHDSEFLYHTWHPGQAGENNYLGPHDGRHVSTTSLEALTSNRVEPHVMNCAIAKLQKDSTLGFTDVARDLIFADYEKIAKMNFLMGPKCREWAENTYKYFNYKGFIISQYEDGYSAESLYDFQKSFLNNQNPGLSKIKAASIELIKAQIDKNSSLKLNLSINYISLYFLYRSVKRVLKKLIVFFLKGTKTITKSIFIKMNGLIGRPKNKIINIYDENIALKKDIVSLCANIVKLLNTNSNENIVLMVSSRAEYEVIRILKRLSIRSGISLVFIKNQFSFLKEMEIAEQEKKQLVVSRQTYLQYLNIFVGSYKNLIII